LILIGYFSAEIFIAKNSTSLKINEALKENSLTLKLSDFSEHQLNILIKVEDPNYYNHKGIDTETPGAGWTTITQGLVKIYYFNRSFKPGFLRINKIRQTSNARFVYHLKISKKDQLKLFINNVYFGSF
jgi:membrane carboxypeptidase/penicillin-binding protein